MKTMIPVVLALAAILSPSTCVGADELSQSEASTLRFMREEEKMARDVYLEMFDLWNMTIFENIAASEQRHMDVMLKMIERYGLEDPVGDNPRGVFTDPDLAAMFDARVDQGSESEIQAFHSGALIEEQDIIDLDAAIAGTDEDPLIRAYSNLRSGSCNHLRAFVGHIIRVEGAYEPKLLDESAFLDCVGSIEDIPVSNGAFSINPGLNDAWYYPGTNGQGFSVTVFPGVKRVMLIWFTFEAETAGGTVTAVVGDPDQRWLVAEGYYDGAVAEMELYSMSGGAFDFAGSNPNLRIVGSATLSFDNCDSGLVAYDMPGAGLAGEIPIQRINQDNVARCLQEEPSEAPTAD